MGVHNPSTGRYQGTWLPCLHCLWYLRSMGESSALRICDRVVALSVAISSSLRWSAAHTPESSTLFMVFVQWCPPGLTVTSLFDLSVSALFHVQGCIPLPLSCSSLPPQGGGSCVRIHQYKQIVSSCTGAHSGRMSSPSGCRRGRRVGHGSVSPSVARAHIYERCDWVGAFVALGGMS